MRTLLTVRDLLASTPLHGAQLLGGATGLDAVVHDVVQVAGDEQPLGLPSGAAAVFDVDALARTGSTYRQHLVEVITRRLHARAGRLLVVTGPHSVPAPMSTRRLADRLGLPLVAAPEAAATSLTAALLGLVHTPGIDMARTVAAAARRLPLAGGELDGTVGLVDEVLDARTAAITVDGTLVAGSRPRLAHTLLPPRPATVAEHLEDLGVAVCPVPGVDAGPVLYLVAEAEGAGLAWADTAVTVLNMAAAYVAGRHALDRLSAERDARYHAALLAELLEAGDPLPAPLAERAAKAGWRLEGWHTAVYLVVVAPASEAPGALSVAVRARLGDALGTAGVMAALVERAGGWVTWVTEAKEPAATAGRTLANRLRSALADYHGGVGVPAVVLGIGRPAPGASGLATSVAEARQAALVASASHRAGAVQHVDELGVKRLLLGWYGSAAFREYAGHLLAPLLTGEAGDQLVETVETYLDTGCAPTETAARLGVHRNTVTQRIHRVETLLRISFDNPDERLAVHLACRALRLSGVT